MVKQEPAMLFWIPTILLCCVLIPMNLNQNTIYIEFALPCVGFFALWLCVANFLLYEPNVRDPKKGLINLVLALIYNPIMTNLSLAYLLGTKSYTYLILLNLFCALVFLYQWCIKRKKQSVNTV